MTMKECWIGRGLLALIVFLSVLIVYISKQINAWNARFFNALRDTTTDRFLATYRVGEPMPAVSQGDAR
jgi:ABC-type uncharacterized transport system fused permease/ATPase subunit